MDTATTQTQQAKVKGQGEPLTLDVYARLVDEPDWTYAEIYRAIVVNLPRELHGFDAATRLRVLRDAPPLTGTPWDALLAATAEHIARGHSEPLQPWMDEPERFMDTPWFAKARPHLLRWQALCYAPAAFIRHGTPIHPSDLDARGGDEPWEGEP